MATSRPTRRWCWQGRRHEAARACRDCWPSSWRALAGRQRRGSGRAGLHQPPARRLRSGTPALPTCCSGRHGLRRLRPSAAASRSMSNMSRPIRPGRCTSAMAAARVVGDALAALLAKVGFAVTREYYINDAGAQVDALARSAYLRYREALGDDIGAIPEGSLPRRLSEGRRPGVGGARRGQMARRAGERVACAGAPVRHRSHDGADPRRSRTPRRRPRRLHLRTRPGRSRRRRACARAAGRPRG